MKKTLFNIEESMYNLLNYNVDDETGEMIETEEEFQKKYEDIQMDADTKIDNTNCLMKLIDGEVDVIDKEIERLKKLKKSKLSLKNRLFNMVNGFIERSFQDEEGNIDYDKLSKYKKVLEHSQVSFRKSVKTIITDESKIPKKFLKIKKVVEPDKKEIKKYLNQPNENGKLKNVKWAKLSTNYNMQVK